MDLLALCSDIDVIGSVAGDAMGAVVSSTAPESPGLGGVMGRRMEGVSSMESCSWLAAVVVGCTSSIT